MTKQRQLKSCRKTLDRRVDLFCLTHRVLTKLREKHIQINYERLRFVIYDSKWWPHSIWCRFILGVYNVRCMHTHQPCSIQHRGYMRRMKLQALRLCSHHCHAASLISIIKQDSHKGPSVLLAFSINRKHKNTRVPLSLDLCPPPLFLSCQSAFSVPHAANKRHTQQSISQCC